METGDIIKKLRTEKGITQEQLADVLGLKKSAIAKYESGRVKNIKRETINAMAIYFGVRPSYILGESDESLILNADEIEIVKAYRNASDDTKEGIRLILGVDNEER